MEIFKRHGLKLSFGFFLGFLLAVISLIVGFTILGIVSALLFQASLTDIQDNPKALGAGVFLLFIIIYIGSILSLGTFIQSGLVSSVNDAVFRNRSSVGGFISLGLKNFWKFFKLILSMVVVAVPLLIIFAIIYGLLYATGITESSAAIVIDILLFLLFLFVMYGITLHSPIIMLEEKLGTWQSIKASIQVTLGSFGKVLVSMILYFLSTLGVILGYMILCLLLLAPMGLTISYTDLDSFAATSAVVAITLFLMYVVYFILILPMSYVIGQMIITSRYKNKIRPTISGPSNPFVTNPNSGSMSNPTYNQPNVPPTQPTQPNQSGQQPPNFPGSFTFEPVQPQNNTPPSKKDDDEFKF